MLIFVKTKKHEEHSFRNRFTIIRIWNDIACLWKPFRNHAAVIRHPIRHSKQMIDRYFLDIRTGCGAVRDRQHESYDEGYPGLHQDTPDVVLYRHGIYAGGLGWSISEADIKDLGDLCDRVNVWPIREKILNELGL
jgi:hypothetical protein